jgi:hypothetical protein
MAQTAAHIKENVIGPHPIRQWVVWDICQLVSGTADGFPEAYDSLHTSGPDPPEFGDNIESPHWEDSFIQYD